MSNASACTFAWHLDDADVERFHQLLQTTYWASQRSLEDVRRSLEASLVIAAHDPHDGLVGCARAVTDRVTHTWICDVVVHPSHRGRDIGRQMIEQLLAHPDIRPTKKVLVTKDAQPFYRKLGFETHAFECMSRSAGLPDAGPSA